jgi:transcription elongation factor GreB
MRKGFTRQPKDDAPAVRLKNYITPSGLQRLKDEHRFLRRRMPLPTAPRRWSTSSAPTKSISTATTSAGCHSWRAR